MTSEATAHALNVVAAYVTDFLGAAGIDGEFILVLLLLILVLILNSTQA